MFRKLAYPLVFVLGCLWFSWFQIWGAFPDPDAFYHAKMAVLIGQHGPLLNFPWLDLTTLHSGFSDQHLLFHYFQIPFVQWFGMLPGAQWSAVIAGGLFCLAAFWVFRRLAISPAWFWTALLAVLPPIVIRLSLGKASPFAVALFMIGLVAACLRKPILAFAVGFVYALLHGGWPLLLAAQLVMVFGSWLYERWVMEKKGSFDIKIFLSTLGGCLLGTFVHPNFPDNIPHLWVQIFSIGVATPMGRVIMGTEWYPYSVHQLVLHLSVLVLIVCVIGYGLFIARKRELDHQQAARVLGFGLLSACLLAMTFKSARFVEYLVPVLVLWLGSLYQILDQKKLVSELRMSFRFAPHLVLVCLLFLVGKGAVSAKRDLRDAAKPFSKFEKSMEFIRTAMKPEERLFHSDWAQFPMLWVQDDQIRYIAGLDPGFLLQANPELSDAYTDLTLGKNTSTAFEVIHGTFGANVVLVERKKGQKLDEILKNDKGFEQIYVDDEAIVFRTLIHR